MGYKVLQIEWYKICHVLVFLLCYASFGYREHPFCQWLDTLDESCVGMVYHLHALLGPVSEEVYGSAVEIFAIGFCIYHIGLNATHLVQGAVVYSRINLHAACVNHRAQQCTLLYLLAQKHRHSHEFECRHGNKL